MEQLAETRAASVETHRDTHFYVFVVREGEPDENGLSATYRLVANLHDRDGRWLARTPQEAIRLAAQGRNDIYAAFPAATAVVERWPLLQT